MPPGCKERERTDDENFEASISAKDKSYFSGRFVSVVSWVAGSPGRLKTILPTPSLLGLDAMTIRDLVLSTGHRACHSCLSFNVLTNRAPCAPSRLTKLLHGPFGSGSSSILKDQVVCSCLLRSRLLVLARQVGYSGFSYCPSSEHL